MNSFSPTANQKDAIDKFEQFINNPDANIFILKGYAGTGKSTLVKQFIHILCQKKLIYKILASTGRAAKIISDITGREAKTVHSEVYKYAGLNRDLEEVVNNRGAVGEDDGGQLFLVFGFASVDSEDVTYYFIDEASMVSDQEDHNPSQAKFGSGKLLSDLIKYDPNGKFIFVGDVCQLPPVGQKFSPALSEEYFSRNFGCTPYVSELTEIVRQVGGNDIIKASHRMRVWYKDPPKVKWGKFQLKGMNNIKIYPDKFSFLNSYIKNIKKYGYNSATLLCASNKNCDEVTKLIRPSLGFNDATLMKDDLLLVTQNNVIGLMNGDLVKVRQVFSRERRAGLTFIHIEVEEMVSKRVYSLLAIEDVIYSDKTNITPKQNKELFIDFFIRMKKEGISQKDPRFLDKMMKDEYLNALRAVYGYALTCHKAQGGEWNDVYIDIPRFYAYQPGSSTYQWLYTSLTRAKLNVHLVDDFYL